MRGKQNWTSSSLFWVLVSFYVQESVRKIPQNISPKILAWNTISDVKAEFPLFSVRIFCLGLKSFEKPLLKKNTPPHIFQHETIQGLNSETGVPSLIWTAAWIYTSIH